MSSDDQTQSQGAPFKTITIEVNNYVAQVKLNRPERSNAMDETLWREIGEAFQWLDEESDARVAVLSGSGKNFCAGLDFSFLMQITSEFASVKCEGRKREKLRRRIMWMQEAFNAIEDCRIPVIAAIHGACVGGAIDLITACDLRYCSEEAYFNVKEVDLGLAADVGTLQRLPALVGLGVAREWAYLACNIDAAEGKRTGLINNYWDNPETMFEEVNNIATTIAGKSPLAIRGSKRILSHARDNSVADGLDYVATWSAGVLVSNDSAECMQAKMQKRETSFEDLVK